MGPQRGHIAEPHEGVFMSSVPLDGSVANLAPADPIVTAYDEVHLVTYLRLLDAEADNADWRDVARLILRIDPAQDPDRARKAFDSHLARAKWMASRGYRDLLAGRIDRGEAE
jgi:Uncharacterized conserved protein (DUF2285)